MIENISTTIHAMHEITKTGLQLVVELLNSKLDPEQLRKIFSGLLTIHNQTQKTINTYCTDDTKTKFDISDFKGAYYLHINGSIIWKPAGVFYNTTPEEYFEGGFVVKYWWLPNGNINSQYIAMLTMILEALANSTNLDKTIKDLIDITKDDTN